MWLKVGEIHYVKVPIGKRKVDAQKAIEKMQGFPIGGSRIRLSWGRRCTDKAAVAQIQETQLQSPPVPGNANANATGVGVGGMRMTHDEALALLQKLQTGFAPPPNGYSAPSAAASANVDSVVVALAVERYFLSSLCAQSLLHPTSDPFPSTSARPASSLKSPLPT
ncbi:hypothetical protein B0H14DRAFT_2596023 [Mycena olivaceomarginata]|nr:hypothetical protein B0H14DRAFT_2596023 [Mycena olivaceomarginata]